MREDEIEDQKVRENRHRREANRQGLRLMKSRRRDDRASSYGLYALIDARTRGTINPAGPVDIYSWTLDDVARYLTVPNPDFWKEGNE